MYGITGANGFLGRAIAQAIGPENVRCFQRSPSENSGSFFLDLSKVDSFDGKLLCNLDVVIHCAARVHLLSEKGQDALFEFRKINVEGTLKLAKKAARAGVERFVYISSIKVNGEETKKGERFTNLTKQSPQDPYGQSKMEAERSLTELCKEAGMELVIVRPPLVYGPGVKANFRRLISLVHKKIPLPLDAIDNSRSLVGLDNLVDLIITCSCHPAAVNQTFLVSDDDDVSTPELVRRIGRSLGNQTRLIPVPVAVLQLLGKTFGKSDQIHRLCSNLKVDIDHTQKTLGWKPPFTMQEQLDKTVKDYKRRNR